MIIKKTHPNIRSINKVINSFGCSSFTFQFPCIDETVKNVNGLDHEKTYTFEVSDILFKIIKENPDSVAFLWCFLKCWHILIRQIKKFITR